MEKLTPEQRKLSHELIMNDRRLELMQAHSEQIIRGVALKNNEYGDSWKARGGPGAYMTFARKWDRLEAQCKKNGYDIFDLLDKEDDEVMESIGMTIDDLIGYLLLLRADRRTAAGDHSLLSELPLPTRPIRVRPVSDTEDTSSPPAGGRLDRSESVTEQALVHGDDYREKEPPDTLVASDNEAAMWLPQLESEEWDLACDFLARLVSKETAHDPETFGRQLSMPVYRRVSLLARDIKRAWDVGQSYEPVDPMEARFISAMLARSGRSDDPDLPEQYALNAP